MRTTLGVTDPWWPTEDEIDAQVRDDLDGMDLPTVGADGPRLFAVTPDEARTALRHFVEHRLDTFGPYEDAILSGDPWMAHSLLSVPQNLGVLHPLEAVHAAEQAYRDGEARLNSVEGFVRQILGWREYIWHLYWHFGKGYSTRNEMDHRTPLPTWWTELDGDAVSAACLSETLKGVRDRGWVHHIPRLMVLGNHALQREYRPGALSEWFTTSFVDGFAWVMPPNVVGMSQHADGGKLATKPYSSGGAYINKMSDHCGDCVFDPKVRVGEKACPFTAGYWQFVHRHQDLLRANQRTARAVATMDRLKDLDAVLEQEKDRHGVLAAAPPASGGVPRRVPFPGVGAVAQLVAHHTGSVRVRGSSPLSSTHPREDRRPRAAVLFRGSTRSRRRLRPIVVEALTRRATGPHGGYDPSRPHVRPSRPPGWRRPIVSRRPS